MLQCCSAQREFIKQSITHNIRIDGRNTQTRRSLVIKSDVITHLPGSSYIYLMYQNLEIYVGVKIKIEEIGRMEERKEIVLELSSMRKLGEEENQEMKRIQYILNKRIINKLTELQEVKEFLRISGTKKHKIFMFIDVFFLTTPHISQLEFIISAIKSALLSTTISDIDVSYNEVTEQQTIELLKTSRRIKKINCEQICIIGMINTQKGECFVLDMRRQEYESMDACYLVSVYGDKVMYMECLKGSISIDVINKFAKFAIANCCCKNEK